MKFPFLNDPSTGKPSEMVTITVLTTLAVLIRFLFDGITIVIDGHNLTFGHVDAMVYMAVLAPVLGTHGFMSNKKEVNNDDKK